MTDVLKRTESKDWKERMGSVEQMSEWAGKGSALTRSQFANKFLFLYLKLLQDPNPKISLKALHHFYQDFDSIEEIILPSAIVVTSTVAKLFPSKNKNIVQKARYILQKLLDLDSPHVYTALANSIVHGAPVVQKYIIEELLTQAAKIFKEKNLYQRKLLFRLSFRLINALASKKVGISVVRKLSEGLYGFFKDEYLSAMPERIYKKLEKINAKLT